MEALHGILSYFSSSYGSHGLRGGNVMTPNLKEELARRHHLWVVGSGLRSVLIDGGHFITVVASNANCLSFTNGR